MEGFRKLSLEESGVQLFDCIHKTPPEDVFGQYPYVMIPQMKEGRINLSSARRISANHFEEWTKTLLPQPGDVILSRRCNPGVTAAVKDTSQFALGQNLVILRADGRYIFPPFLEWLCRSPEWWAQVSMFINAGSTFDSLRCADIPKFRLSLPTLVEQRAIAGVLSSLDEKIDLLHRQNKTLESLAETLFRQWFIEEAEDWVPITRYVEFNPSRKLTKGSVAPYLDMAGLSTTTFNPQGWYEREFASGTKFQNGDTLLARITPCLENGKTAFVTFLEGDQVGWGSTEFIVMRSVSNLNPFFTYALARNRDFREYAEGCMAGSSGRQRVDVEHLKQFLIGLVSTEKINHFNELVLPITPQLHQNMLQIRTLENLRDTLLPRLMSGEVRVEVGRG